MVLHLELEVLVELIKQPNHLLMAYYYYLAGVEVLMMLPFQVEEVALVGLLLP